MRGDEQRAALDRFADVGVLQHGIARYVSFGRPRDAIWPKNPAGKGNAREADRLKFGLGEIDAVDPQPGEDDALVEDVLKGGC